MGNYRLSGINETVIVKTDSIPLAEELKDNNWIEPDYKIISDSFIDKSRSSNF